MTSVKMPVGLLAGALLCMPGIVHAQQPPTGGASPPGASAMQEHVAELKAQCPAVTRMPEAEASKLPIDVTRWGTTGPAVLIVHGGVQGGLGGGPTNFAKQEVLAKRGWRLMVVDRPGFGKSPTRGVDDMAADSIWVADMLGDGANLIGHSWGGAEALLAAARRPEAVKSLIMIEPAVRVLLTTDSAAPTNPAVKVGADRFAAAVLKTRTPAEYGIVFARGLAKEGTPNAVANALEANPTVATQQGCALLQARMAPFPVIKQAAETIAKAGIPTLIVTGGWNPLYDAGADVLAKLTNGRHVIVSSPDHFVQFTSGEAFNKVADDFMREADAKKAAPSH